jgi:TonB dependent receptor
VNLGIAGLGAFWESPLGPHLNALFAVDRSLLNLATNDAGLDGVPIYTNGMARFEWTPDREDSVSFLSLNGGDSIDVHPCAGDPEETLAIDTQYDGLQSTSGAIWQHTHGPTTVSKATVSFSLQKRNVSQQTQLIDGTYPPGTGDEDCTPPTTAPIYSENTLDRITSFGYTLQHDLHHWLLSAGATGQMLALDYDVNQPAGEQSPFNPDPNWTDAVSFNQSPLTWQTGSYAEITGRAGQRWTATAGLRVETFALTSAHAWEPRAGLGFLISKHQGLHAAYRRSSQLPPYIDLLSYPQNRNLPPIGAQQYSAGADLWRTDRLSLSLEAYRKNYSNEPESAEYPSLMLASMIYTPGEQFVWLPWKTGGTGRSTGLELFLHGRLTDHMAGLVSVTYSRTLYRAADGILRPGNYDFPLVANAMFTFHLPRTYTLSVRDSFSTGRPYTPYNIPLSLQQDRGIYDLSEVNGQRGPAYNRTDISVDRNYYTHSGVVNVYVGLQNIFDQKNFLGYVWLPRCGQYSACIAATDGKPIKEIDQMPAFPVAGVRWDF